MALSSLITVKSVSQSQPSLYNIVFNLLYKDGETVLLDQDFSYSQAAPVTEWASCNANVRKRMKVAIQKYKDEQLILNAAGLATVVTSLNANVGV